MKLHLPYRVLSAYPLRLSKLGVGIFLVLASMVLTPIAGEGSHQGQLQSSKSPPEMNPVPDANPQTKMNEPQAQTRDFEAVNAERKHQLSEQSAMLLKLATDLKSEVDKSSKDTLSVSVVRKAAEIEKLAHDVKEKTKPTVGPS